MGLTYSLYFSFTIKLIMATRSWFSRYTNMTISSLSSS